MEGKVSTDKVIQNLAQVVANQAIQIALLQAQIEQLKQNENIDNS